MRKEKRQASRETKPINLNTREMEPVTPLGI
jgi:hypothetical protein